MPQPFLPPPARTLVRAAASALALAAASAAALAQGTA